MQAFVSHRGGRDKECQDYESEDVIPPANTSLVDFKAIQVGYFDEEWGFEISALQNGKYFRIEQGESEMILSRREMESLRERIREAIRDTNLTNLMLARAKTEGS